MNQRIILVSGSPGAGKTTLALALAGRMKFALLSKDAIKEVLAEQLLGSDDSLESSRRIGGAAMEVMWALARTSPRVILEANFRPNSVHEQARLSALHADLVEVHCWCDPAEAMRRFTLRNAQSPHVAHPLRALSPDLLAEYDGPITRSGAIVLDTSGPTDIEALVVQIAMRWSSESG